MKFVTLQTGATPFGRREPILSEEELAEFTRPLSLRECGAVGEIVSCELARRGLRRVKVGGRYYRAMEALVVSRLARSGVDMWEVAVQVEEAKAEAEATWN